MGFHFTTLDIVINTIFLLITILLAFLNFKYLIKKNYPLKKARRDKKRIKKSLIFFIIFSISLFTISNLILIPLVGFMGISISLFPIQITVMDLFLYLSLDRYIKLQESENK